MIKNVPGDIAAAMQTLWDYAEDACISGRTQQQMIEAGYKCSNPKGGFYIRFTIPYPEGDKPCQIT